MSRQVAYKPVATYRLDMSGTNVTTAAWVTLTAATTKACAAVEIFNPSGSTMQIALGGSGSEVAEPYSILPGGSGIFLPWEIAKAVRISLKAVDTTASTGYFVVNTFA
jgi:hypothetical protein